NCTIPALVNNRVGSSLGSSEAEATSRWPRATKKSRKRRRIFADSIRENIAPGLANQRHYRVTHQRSGKAAPREKREQPSPQHRPWQAAQLQQSLASELFNLGRLRPLGKCGGKGPVHQPALDPENGEITTQSQWAAPPRGAGLDVVLHEAHIVNQA